jgi:serine/threonine-protein kinase
MSELVYSDKYEVQEQIAQGAMGIVYKALDRKLNRVVALKVVHPHLTSDASFLQRFLREARAMARLQHENIVSIFSVEQDHGTQFIVMEYIEGGNLLSRIQPSVNFSLDEAITITYQMAKALAYAHGHGIIHRDVKPANVLLGSDTRIKLTDFGIAAALDDAPLTSAGQLIGTLLYMSPEQARDTTLDGRSDLYSLGLMLYEMLTGIHPRRNLSNVAILGMLTAEEKIPPFTFLPSVPANVQAVVKDLLRYRPVDRINDAHQLLRRLESLEVLRSAVPFSLDSKSSVATDQTICELGGMSVNPEKKRPEKPTRRIENTRQVVIVLLVILAVAGTGAGLYALFPMIKSAFSPQQRVLTQISEPPPLSVPPAPTPPIPDTSPTPTQPAPTSVPTLIQPKPEPVPSSAPPVSKLAPSPVKPELTTTPSTLKPTSIQSKPEPGPAQTSPVSKPVPSSAPLQPKQTLTPVQSKLEPIPTPAPPIPKSASVKPESIPTPSTPVQPKADPVPAPTPLPTEVPRLVKPDQRTMDLLEQLRRLVVEKNLTALSEISVMSDDRRGFLEALFANYSTIEASIGEIVSTSTEVTTVLRIDKLVLRSGESVPPGSTLRKIRITVPREGDGWGQIVW